MPQFPYLSPHSISSVSDLLIKTQGNRKRVEIKKNQEIEEISETETGERWELSISLALPIRQEELCARARLDVCICARLTIICARVCVCVCALHPSPLPLSPPDITLPVTAAWRSQIRPSSTFLLPVVALPSIQHQFQHSSDQSRR